MLTINLIKKYKQEIIDISKWFFDYACDHYSQSDIYYYLEDEFSGLQYRSYDYGRSDGLCVNVKTSIGFKNTPKNPIEASILENYLNEEFHNSGIVYEMEFDSIRESFPMLNIKCLGRSGGYWAIADLDFKTVFEFNNDWKELKTFLQSKLDAEYDDSETFLEHVTDLLEFSFNYTSDPDIKDLICYNVIQVSQDFTNNVTNFIGSCKSIVAYYEDSNKLLDDFYEKNFELDYNNYAKARIVIKYLNSSVFFVAMKSPVLVDSGVVCEGLFSSDNLLEDSAWVFTNKSSYPENQPAKLIEYLNTLFTQLANQEFEELTNLNNVA